MTAKQRAYSVFRKALKIIGYTGVLLIACVLVIAAVLSFQSVRNRLLDYAVKRADGSLPGTLSAERAVWPSIGRIEIDNIVWADRADTLAAAGRLALDIKLLPLAKRDVRIAGLTVESAVINLPGINACRITMAKGRRYRI